MTAITDDPLGHLRYRLDCLYRKLHQARPTHVERFRPIVVRTPRLLAVAGDFRGGLSENQIREIIMGIVFDIALVKDPLKNWMRSRARDTANVERFIDYNTSLQIMIDLANADKHGRLDRWRCSAHPSLGEVGRSLQLRPAGCPGSSVCATLDPASAQYRVSSSAGGTANVIFWGDVVASDGRKLGDVMEYAQDAVATWEKLFGNLGVI